MEEKLEIFDYDYDYEVNIKILVPSVRNIAVPKIIYLAHYPKLQT
jgi:hypothetical protein